MAMRRLLAVLVAEMQLVELDLDRFGVLVRRVLDEEHHQERHDRGAGVDDELPGVAELQERAGQGPHHEDGDGDAEGPRVAGGTRGAFGHPVEQVVQRPGGRPVPVDVVAVVVICHVGLAGIEPATEGL